MGPGSDGRGGVVSAVEPTAVPRAAEPALRARSRRRRWETGYLLCLPAFLCVFGLLAFPIVYDVAVSFTDASAGAAGRFVGLQNYQQLLADPIFWAAARNTAVMVLATATVELGLGLATALLLWWRFWGRAIVFLAVFIPWAVPSSFAAFAWYWLLLPPFHSFYTLQAIQAKLWLDGIFGIGTWQVLSIGVMNVWRGSSIIAIFLLAGFNAIPEELLEYGRLEARSRWRYLWRVVMPLNRRIAILAMAVALTVTYMDFVAMYAETGGRITVPLIGTLAYDNLVMGSRVGYSAALILTQIPVAALLALVVLRFVEREPRPTRPEADGGWSLRASFRPSPRPSRPSPPPTSGRGLPRRRRWRRRALAAAGVLVALAVFAFHLFPVYYTAVQAVKPVSEYPGGQIFWAYHPDLTTLGQALHDPQLLIWGRNTVIVFGAVLALGLVVSLMAGYGLARFNPPGARWAARLMFATYFVPQMAVILPLYRIYATVGLDDTLPGIVLAYLTLMVPFATWLFYSYFLGLDREVEEHAWLDGSRLQVFVRIVLPMCWPVVIAAALFGIGMMGSDILYGDLFSLTNATTTLPVGLGIHALSLDEWANTNAAIILSALPVIALCATLGRYYVQGLRAALLEGA